MRALGAVAMTCAVVVATARPAAAHTVTGIRPTNYRSEIRSIVPPVPGMRFELLDLGRRVRLRNDTNAAIVVLATPSQPERRVAAHATAVWRDRRTRWEGPTPAAVRRSPDRSHVVGSWTIALRVGAATTTGGATIDGRIVWVPPPDPRPWIAVAVVLFAVTSAAAATRWWRDALGFLLALLVAGDVVHSVAAAVFAPASLGVIAARVLVGNVYLTVAWVIGVIAVVGLRRERESALLYAALAGFLIGTLGGGSDADSFGRSQIATSVSPGVARAQVAAALGVGLGLVSAATWRLALAPRLRREPRPPPGGQPAPPPAG